MIPQGVRRCSHDFRPYHVDQAFDPQQPGLDGDALGCVVLLNGQPSLAQYIARSISARMRRTEIVCSVRLSLPRDDPEELPPR